MFNRGVIGRVAAMSLGLMVSTQLTAAEAAPEVKLPPFIAPLPADAAPPRADPQDLRGMWLNYARTAEQILTVEGKVPPFTPSAAAARAAKVKAAQAGMPLANNAVMCRPPGFLWVLGLYFPVRVMQDDDGLTFAFERFHTIWHIAMTPLRSRPARRTYLGFSSGHWEGDTLVVETTGFRAEQWLDDLGTLLSDKARLTTRLTKRRDGRVLEAITEIDDPANYTKPWTVKVNLNWRPDYLVLAEHDCEQSAGQPEDAEKYGYSLQPQ
jgi:hypothetical protein